LVLTGYKDAEGYLPGKLFEYLATGLPVLGVGPVQGDAAFLLRDAGLDGMIDSADIEGIKDALLKQFMRWQANSQPSVRRSLAEKYSRKSITEKLIGLLSRYP
jgi:glycosyltransferase involved in cell wall biosynthesis